LPSWVMPTCHLLERLHHEMFQYREAPLGALLRKYECPSGMAGADAAGSSPSSAAFLRSSPSSAHAPSAARAASSSRSNTPMCFFLPSWVTAACHFLSLVFHEMWWKRELLVRLAKYLRGRRGGLVT